MNWRSTVWLVATALALGLFLLLVERPARLARSRQAGAPLVLPNLLPATIESVELSTPSNAVALRKTAGKWELVRPVRRPAQGTLVEAMIRGVVELRGRPILTPAELRARPQAAAEFGLTPPGATLRLGTASGHTELLIGALSAFGKQVFYQINGVSGIFAADSRLLDVLHSDPDTWRDPTLVPIDPLDFDRLRVTSGAGTFELVRTNSTAAWELTEPRPARADSERVNVLLGQLRLAQVLRFIAPTAAPPPEVTGLRPPRLVLTLARSSNEVFRLTFGASLTNSDAVLAQRPGEEDLLSVPSSAYDLLRISYKELLDRRLLRFDPAAVREITFSGREEFRVVQGTNGWQLLPLDTLADRQLVSRLLVRLTRLEVMDIEKEVVTPLDLPTYGLGVPRSRILLRAFPGDTNAPLAALEVGAFRENRTFARIPGEEPVYALNPAHVEELPVQSWQLRNRLLWQFESATVKSLVVDHDQLNWTLHRVGTNDWAVPAGWRNEINPFALEEALHQFGHSQPLDWIGLGAATAKAFGTSLGPQVVFEFAANPQRPPLRLAFGKSSPLGNRYAAVTTADGAILTFEFPGAIYDDLWREIGISELGQPRIP